MLLSVIIVSYNTKDLTLQTIDSVIESTKNSKLLKNNLEILVADNDSKDDSVKALNKLKETIKIPLTIIVNKQNLGFAKANNKALEKAEGEYIIFLNSDTVVKKNALENMVQRFITDSQEIDEDINKLGILAPVLLNKDLSYQPQGGSLPTLLNLFFHMSMLDDLPIIGKFLPSTQHTGYSNRLDLNFLENYNKLIPTDWVGGTALMTSKKALETFGSLDPNIFMYAEDTEICMRAKHHHFEVAIDPTAQIIHLQNASSSSENAIRGEYKGYLYIFSKHTSSTQTAIAKIILQLGAILRIFVFSILSPNKNKVEIYKKVLSDLN